MQSRNAPYLTFGSFGDAAREFLVENAWESHEAFCSFAISIGTTASLATAARTLSSHAASWPQDGIGVMSIHRKVYNTDKWSTLYNAIGTVTLTMRWLLGRSTRQSRGR